MTHIGRRGLLAAAAIIAAKGPASAQTLPEHERALHEAARREGEITWYAGQLAAEPAEAVGRAFTARYPGVRANVVRSTSQVAFQRLSQDMRAGIAQCDVLSSTDYGHATFLKRQGALMEYRPRNAEQLLEFVRKAGDPDGFFHVFYIGVHPMACHKIKVSAEAAPQNWQDLLDPKWRSQLAVGHPSYSGAIGAWAVAMRKLYGWDYFVALEKNKPQIGRSSIDPVTALNAGERSIGIAVPTASTLLSMARGNPLELIYPKDGTVVVPSPSSIQKNAPHPNAAKLFMEFATGPEYFRVTREFYNESLRPDVPPPDGAVPLESVPILVPTPQELETGVAEVKEQWRDTFGI
ncbi:extracellular solute-binding protein [Roseomonas aerophila]|uniref:Extracellular solute-binding protein n=1 Tax=Teichococcus aerophilus TaxID=1224513 RepID=A0ABR7RJ62_9PROT|nr:extracellular solute-binding protein [Pseudoroseomonas aerophila]MBC9206353.1 extracellular solute-binding protein [Pseudoroseomonas aerophila]